MKQDIAPFIRTQNQKQLFTMQTLIVHLNQSIVRYDKITEISGRRLGLYI